MKFNTKANIGIIKHTFTDEDGDEFASCRINPTDVKLLKRAEEVSEFFQNAKVPDNVTPEELIEYNDMLEEKICHLLGYDARQELFGLLPATSINQDGEMWAVIVMDAINEHIAPEIEKRKSNMAAAIDKYTGKYTK